VTHKPQLLPYVPGRPCPKSATEGASPRYHERPVLAVFGSSGQWPCSGLDGQVGSHMCTRCECGYTWMESVSSDPGSQP
jgi:hypothetical protein